MVFPFARRLSPYWQEPLHEKEATPAEKAVLLRTHSPNSGAMNGKETSSGTAEAL